MNNQLRSSVFGVFGIRCPPLSLGSSCLYNIFRRHYVVSHKRDNNVLEEYRADILNAYQIPGKYLKYIKKNRRQLKKEAYFTANYGSEVGNFNSSL
jgi:hypothetical protein